MKRGDLEHVLRACGGIVGPHRFVVIGSQSILGAVPNPPAELVVSEEVDVFVHGRPADAELIDGSIGEGSPFHATFGYYAHGVGEETATLPRGWEQRLVEVRGQNTGGATGLCLEPHDLAVSKLVAGREKDTRFVATMLAHRIVSRAVIDDRLGQTDVSPALRAAAEARLARCDGRGD